MDVKDLFSYKPAVPSTLASSGSSTPKNDGTRKRTRFSAMDAEMMQPPLPKKMTVEDTESEQAASEDMTDEEQLRLLKMVEEDSEVSFFKLEQYKGVCFGFDERDIDSVMFMNL